MHLSGLFHLEAGFAPVPDNAADVQRVQGVDHVSVGHAGWRVARSRLTGGQRVVPLALAGTGKGAGTVQTVPVVAHDLDALAEAVAGLEGGHPPVFD